MCKILCYGSQYGENVLNGAFIGIWKPMVSRREILLRHWWPTEPKNSKSCEETEVGDRFLCIVYTQELIFFKYKNVGRLTWFYE